MRFSPIVFALLPFAYANSENQPDPADAIRGSVSYPPAGTPAHASSTPTSIVDSSRGFWQPIPQPLQQFIANFHRSAEDIELERRQIAPGGGAPVAQPTIPTQLSPTTTYWFNGKQIVYTQTFAPTPDPWPAPQNGEIGMGTLTGTYGVPQSKR
jgi:hypothetical protein